MFRIFSLLQYMQAYLHEITVYFFVCCIIMFTTTKQKVIETSPMMRRHVIDGHHACDR